MKKLALLFIALTASIVFAGAAGAFSYEYYSGGQAFGNADAAIFGFDLAYLGSYTGTAAPGLSLTNDVILFDTLGDPPYDLTSSYFKVVLSANPTPDGVPVTPTGNLSLVWNQAGSGITYDIFTGAVDTTGTYFFNLGSPVLNALRDPYGELTLTASSNLYLTEVGIAVQPVPIPPAVLLLGTGVVGLLTIRRRRPA